MSTDTQKHRRIRFRVPHEDRNQAASAEKYLQGVQGIFSITLTKEDPLSIQVHYDLREVTLEIIENALDEVGFHLDNSLFSKLSYALYHYTEDVQRTNMGMRHDHGKAATREVFINRYQQSEHGCRDARPDHWRGYL